MGLKYKSFRLGRYFGTFGMINNVNTVEEDDKGNILYLSEMLNGRTIQAKTDFDMSNLNDKALALMSCTPFSTVVNKCGSLFSNGRYYVQDKDGNEKKSFNDIRALLSKPNPLQPGRQFMNQIEITLKAFGFCPIFTLRATRKSLPQSMWIIPPVLFHVVSTGKVFMQSDLKGIIKESYIEWGNERINLDEEDYFIIYDSEMIISPNENDILFASATDCLSMPINNWMAQMAASGTLIVNGGPKGIICSDNGNSEFGNTQLNTTEQKLLNDTFKEKYGLVNKLYSILVTKASLKWIPLNYNSNQLKLHEEDERCTKAVYSALGVNYNLFSDGKYDNQMSASKMIYQDVIIPDAEKISEALTSNLCQEGVFIKIDYSHIECLQKDKKAMADTIAVILNAMSGAVKDSTLTPEEARSIIAEYVDIDPDNPNGTFRNNIQNNGSNE